MLGSYSPLLNTLMYLYGSACLHQWAWTTCPLACLISRSQTSEVSGYSCPVDSSWRSPSPRGDGPQQGLQNTSSHYNPAPLAPGAEQLDILRNALLQPAGGSRSDAAGSRGDGRRGSSSGDGRRDSGDGEGGVGEGGGEMATLQNVKSLEDLEYYLEDAFQRAQTFVKKHKDSFTDERLRSLQVRVLIVLGFRA